MKRSETRILTTHAGSLPRPPELLDLYVRRAGGEDISPEELEGRVQAALRWVIPRQEAAGVDIGNNGEAPREGFFLYAQHRMSGFEGSWERPFGRDATQYPTFMQLRASQLSNREAVTNFGPPEAVGEVEYLDPEAANKEGSDFKAVLEETGSRFVEGFLTAPSPGIIATAMRNRHYDTQEAYVNAIADALRFEYEAIVRNGFVLQLDCPDLAMERHMLFADRPLSEFLAFAEIVVDAINRALINIPRERVRLHVCWGNYEGPHNLDIPLDDLRSTLASADVGAFVFPLGNPRHAHEYHSFEQTPLADDQVLVAGVIDTTSNLVEHPEVVAERLERIARAVGDPTRVIAGTDCGFDTSAGMGAVAEEVVWAKLSALAEGARLATERLY
tara:strand:+ start:590 stop:1753 length:1164 start_codon:yes stop_codon:yes gene_type:complete